MNRTLNARNATPYLFVLLIAIGVPTESLAVQCTEPGVLSVSVTAPYGWSSLMEAVGTHAVYLNSYDDVLCDNWRLAATTRLHRFVVVAEDYKVGWASVETLARVLGASPGNCYTSWTRGERQLLEWRELWGGNGCVPTNPPPPPPTICGDPHACQEPLVLDLDGGGIYTTDVDVSPVRFDLNGDGVSERTAWTRPDTDEGILYFDHNKNGVIDGGAELFGDVTVLSTGARAATGFAALTDYDLLVNGGNEDGVITSADHGWHKMRLWVDRDHNGLVSHDENYTLNQRNVVELSTSYVTMTAAENFGLDAQGNWHLFKSRFKQELKMDDGRKVVVDRALHDIFFRTLP
jgi:hypothetical protein